MSSIENALERRAAAFQVGWDRRVKMLQNAIAPEGQRPPFTTALTEEKALDWWRRNYQTPDAIRMLQAMKMDKIVELQARMSRQIEADHLTPTRTGL